MRAKDIAKQLGLSPATVSLVLNNKPGISQNTRKRILTAIAESDFNPQKTPTTNISATGDSICFLVFKRDADDVIEDSQFLSNVIEGLGKEASEHNYKMSISYINNNEINEFKVVVNALREGEIAGLLILATEMEDKAIKEITRLCEGLPVVLLDRHSTEHIDSIALDNITGMQRATEELIKAGHTDIGFINSKFWLHNFEERFNGMKQALAIHNLKLNNSHYLELTPTIEGGANDMKEYINNTKSLPTAFAAANDVVAIGAIKGLKESGIKVPEDISIVGFDDLPYCEITDPPLSTLRVPKERMGRIAMSRLIQNIERITPEKIMLRIRSELILRKSIGKRKANLKK